MNIFAAIGGFMAFIIVAVIILVILSSCIRVVSPGTGSGGGASGSLSGHLQRGDPFPDPLY